MLKYLNVIKTKTKTISTFVSVARINNIALIYLTWHYFVYFFLFFVFFFARALTHSISHANHWSFIHYGRFPWMNERIKLENGFEANVNLNILLIYIWWERTNTHTHTYKTMENKITIQNNTNNIIQQYQQKQLNMSHISNVSKSNCKNNNKSVIEIQNRADFHVK